MANLIITNDPAREAGEKISSLIREHVGDVVCILASGSASDIIEYIDLSKYCFHQDCAEAKENSSDEEYTKCQRNECRTIFIMGDEWVSGEAKINNYLQLQSRYPKHQVLSNTISTIPELGESAKTFSERIEKTFLEIFISII